MRRRNFLQLSLSTLAASALPSSTRDAEIPKLRQIAHSKGLYFGTAVSDSQLKRPEFTPLLFDQCSMLVAENQMKWRATHPEQDRFDFTQADFFMDFAESHHIPARGHNLCWHEHNPTWLDSAITQQNAVSLLTTHIQAVVGRYKGRIHSWDVLNEAIDPTHKNPQGLRNSLWLQNIGEDYVELAFRTAAKADPAALLTYNDYDIETDAPSQQAKREAVLAMLQRLIKKGVPIQALGVQSHLRTNEGTPTWTGLNKFLLEIEKLNLQVFVTELDVDDSFMPAGIPERDRQVAELYRSYLENILRPNSVKAVLTWCLSDRDSWLQKFRPRKDGLPQRPLPLDAQLNPKPAFFALRDTLASKP
ncbi:MAG TPA: endo-1,4-beta-xylanase [Candidatus Acidoferrum sp.]|nr:endo-1,4-beta-xylanase [Candidatus Acidoferrum sp.]